MKTAKVFFYVQHLLGIGHLVRASRIARALAEDDFRVTMISGGTPVAGFPGPPIDLVALPPLKAAPGFAGLEDMNGKPVTESLKSMRCEQLLAALRRNAPDAIVIEAFPFGRRQMRFELLPLLAAAREMRPRPLILCSVRDILQDVRKPGRLEETASIVQDYFDLVMVHGDPSFAKFDETFPAAHSVADRIAYTGLVAGPTPKSAGEKFDIVVSAGGGGAGLQLVKTAIDAASRSERQLHWCLITGPHLPTADLQALSAKIPPNLHLFAFRNDFAELLGAARLSVSQAGYNTVCDILQANCRALLVPFAEGGESEQTIRADKLAAMDQATVLLEKNLATEALLRAIAACLIRAPPKPHGLNLRGAEGTREILRRYLTKD
ncbi:MAG TPA: glycosyltransferase [Aestuariivirgaceae bacterium]|jgi:predicted glycosyltransferase